MAGHVLRGPKLVGYGYEINDRNDKVAMKCLDKWKQVYRERNKKTVLVVRLGAYCKLFIFKLHNNIPLEEYEVYGNQYWKCPIL